MKVVVVCSNGDHVRDRVDGADIIVHIVPLFDAVVHAVSEKAKKVFDKIKWDEVGQERWVGTMLRPVVSASFSLITEGEMVALLRKTIDDVEIFRINRLPQLLF